MAYASTIHVQARSARTFSASSIPSLEDVAGYLTDAAAELDGILIARGYQLPVANTATIALGYLQRASVSAALAAAETRAPTGKSPDEAKRLQADWQYLQQQLRDGMIELDLSRDASLLPRGATLDEVTEDLEVRFPDTLDF